EDELAVLVDQERRRREARHQVAGQDQLQRTLGRRTHRLILPGDLRYGALVSAAGTIKGLAGLRVAIGVTAWLFPNLAGRLFGLDPESNPQAPYLARLFGVRDIALGLG